MASGFTVQLPEGTRGLKENRKIELEDITSESFKHFINHAGIRPQFGNIRIKSYYQRTLMQSMCNLLGSFASGVEAASNAVASMDSGTLKSVASKIQKTFEGLTTEGAFANISNILINGTDAPPGDPVIYRLPFLLEKGLFATEAGSTLTLPFPTIGTNTLMMSDSNYGWGESEGFKMFGNSSGWSGAILKTLAINITPMFSPGKGGGETPKITITFDLINDTLDKFDKHTKFIKGVVSQNMWIQYGLVQGPGALYDIKVGDYMSYFMCTGNIQVTPKGTWRKHGTNDIPDIFSVTMTFSSLLPNNYNAYLWGQEGFSSSFYGGGKKGALQTILDNAKKAFNEL